MTPTVEFRDVVAVDGPSGSGKSTVSRRLALRLGARYLDTGAMYRAVALAVLRAGVDPGDSGGVAALVPRIRLEVGTDPDAPTIRLDGDDVAAEIRGPAVTHAVSPVSAVPAVREAMVAAQRALAGTGGMVVEGRDIGTVVLPDARLKVYLTASASERARRRSAEMDAPADRTRAELDRRDALDSGRATSPLSQAADAVLLDTTALGVDQVVAEIMNLLETR